GFVDMDADHLAGADMDAGWLAVEALGLEHLGHPAFERRMGFGHARRPDQPRGRRRQPGIAELAHPSWCIDGSRVHFLEDVAADEIGDEFTGLARESKTILDALGGEP